MFMTKSKATVVENSGKSALTAMIIMNRLSYYRLPFSDSAAQFRCDLELIPSFSHVDNGIKKKTNDAIWSLAAVSFFSFFQIPVFNRVKQEGIDVGIKL
jgi:hypothetical protein